jgi:hypothetical protein
MELAKVIHLPGMNNPIAAGTSNPKKKSAKPVISLHIKRSNGDDAP